MEGRNCVVLGERLFIYFLRKREAMDLKNSKNDHMGGLEGSYGKVK